MPRKKKRAPLPCKVYGRENRLEQMLAILTTAPDALDQISVDMAYAILWMSYSEHRPPEQPAATTRKRSSARS